jgi:phosphomannomutase
MPEPASTESLIVSASGIRGVVGDGLGPEVAARFGAAYGTFLGERAGGADPLAHVLVARDSRTSGSLLVDAVAAGLRATGWSVRDGGILATPTALLAAQDDEDAAGCVVVTASHNPVEWNGLKLAAADGTFLGVEEGRRVEAIYRSGPSLTGWDELGGRDPMVGAVDHHVERILGLEVLDPGSVAEAGLRVVLDAVRGAGGEVTSRTIRRLGCEVEGLDLEPDGRFPRPPEPVPEQLGRLGERVVSTGADLGMAIDPDGDRLALVDGEGRPIGESWTLALAAEYVLRRRKGALVTNLSSSRCILDAAERAGCPWHLAPVGEANVARRMREVAAVVGGEGNGGVMLPELHLTRDAPLAAALVLGMVVEEDLPLERIVAERPRYHLARRRLPRPEETLDPAYRRLEDEAGEGARADHQDGLRLDWPDERSWVHVRPSGTEPIVRVVAEADERAPAEELADWAADLVRSAVGSPPAGDESG